MTDFYPRFDALLQAGGYQGALEIHPEDLAGMHQVLAAEKSESSKHAVQVAEGTPRERVEEVHALMNSKDPEVKRAVLESVTSTDLRAGTRKGELSVLSGFTLYFALPTVYTSSQFSKLIDDSLDVLRLNRLLVRKGYSTELTDSI